MNLAFVILAAFEIGFFSGLRAFSPLALVSWLAVWGWIPLAGSRFWFVGTTPSAALLSILALGELIADKLPKMPPRTQPGLLAARVITGALSAAGLCFSAGRSWWFGIFFGSLGGADRRVCRLSWPPFSGAAAKGPRCFGGSG